MGCGVAQHRRTGVLRGLPGTLPRRRRRSLGRLRNCRASVRGRRDERAPRALFVTLLQHRIQRCVEAFWMPVASSSDGSRSGQPALLDPVLKRPDADAENSGDVFARKWLEGAWVRLRRSAKVALCPGGGKSGGCHGRSARSSEVGGLDCHGSALKLMTCRLATRFRHPCALRLRRTDTRPAPPRSAPKALHVHRVQVRERTRNGALRC